MTKLDIRSKAEAIRERLATDKKINDLGINRELVLTPNIRPFAVGCDQLAEKFVALVDLFTANNIKFDSITRTDLLNIVMEINDISLTLELTADGEFFLYGMVDLVDLVDGYVLDKLEAGLTTLYIFDDYFCDLDDDNY